jgi:hypothetical protein
MLMVCAVLWTTRPMITTVSKLTSDVNQLDRITVTSLKVMLRLVIMAGTLELIHVIRLAMVLVMDMVLGLAIVKELPMVPLMELILVIKLHKLDTVPDTTMELDTVMLLMLTEKK